MAGPHVAGLVALLWSANPHLIGQIDQTIAIVRQSATPIEVSAACQIDSKPAASLHAGTSDSWIIRVSAPARRDWRA